MIKTQIIKEDNKPVAVIMDFKEYKRLKEIEEDKIDYYSAIEVKRKNKKWKSHSDLKKNLGYETKPSFISHIDQILAAFPS